MKHPKIIIGSIVGILIMSFLSFLISTDSNIPEIPVTEGHIEKKIVTSGELIASKSEKINCPGDKLRGIGIWSVSISEIIDEGTKVDSGDFVASLDPDEVETKLREVHVEINKMKSVYVQTKIDTSLKLRIARNDLLNLEFSMSEAKIVAEESTYESPEVIRKNEILYEKAKIKYNQSAENYSLFREQFVARMEEAQADLDKAISRKNRIEKVISEFTVFAPKSGVIIYTRSPDGSKIAVGSRINTWNPVVAELPNFENMNSRTYVNEVDINLVKMGQKVEIGLDGMPDKKLHGEVIYKSSVGEELKNSGSKVFEVLISIDKSDTTMLPGMSSSNSIIVASADNVIMIPIECVFEDDTSKFVYVKESFSYKKRTVSSGIFNNSHIQITKGLSKGEIVLYIDVSQEL